MIPKISSVSLLPDLLKSTITFATIALDEIVMIPTIINVSNKETHYISVK